MKENRRYARLDTSLNFSFERRGPTSTLKGTATTRNISATGLRFTTPTPLGVGEKISGTLTLPTGEKISFDSRIKWIQSVNATLYDIGAEISQISVEDQNRYLFLVCDLLYDRLQELRLL